MDMSLDDAPPPTLKLLKGRLESIETAWTIETHAAKRKEINEEFKALSEEIKKKYGEEGVKAVNEVLAKHKSLNFSRY
jgi:GTPase SAR1 family protein